MKKEGRPRLTLEERLKRAARSQASSPEAAAKLVERLSQTHIAYVFHESADFNLMYELMGQFMNALDDDVLHYGGFCRSFELAVATYGPGSTDPSRRLPSPAFPAPVWGVEVNNAVVLLGLMLLDHAKGRRRDRDVYHCTRMTLGQYLDALPEPEAPWKRWSVEKWRDGLLTRHDPSQHLAEALADILRSYIDGWQEFDHVDYVLRCMGGLACYLEQEGPEKAQVDPAQVRQFREALCQYSSELEGWKLVEVDKRYPDPCGYYFTLANEYPGSAPDPGGGGVPAGAVRLQIFLHQWDYNPRTLRALAEQSPSPDLGALLEKSVSEERLSAAMGKINTAVTDLYSLWVEPYLRMEYSR